MRGEGGREGAEPTRGGAQHPPEQRRVRSHTEGTRGGRAQGLSPDLAEGAEHPPTKGTPKWAGPKTLLPVSLSNKNLRSKPAQ